MKEGPLLEPYLSELQLVELPHVARDAAGLVLSWGVLVISWGAAAVTQAPLVYSLGMPIARALIHNPGEGCFMLSWGATNLQRL